MRKDDEKWPIPEKFRASLDTADEAAYQRLLANDAEQLALSERVNSPFTRSSPQDIERSKALITIQVLSQVQRTPEQTEQFAECWAAIGRYDVAAQVSELHKHYYDALWKAVHLDDGQNCKCDDTHLYVKERVWSEKHQDTKSLIVCNECNFSNVRSTPEHLKRGYRRATKHQGATKGMSIADCKKYHTDKV